MIKLSSSSVMIINPDGSKQEFESDDLQTRIIKSCLAAGIREAWIAEDISLAVEYAINSSDAENKAFAVSEINSMVIKILQETGYPDVAEKFKLENAVSELEIKPDHYLLSELIGRHIGLTGKKLEDVVSQLQAATEKLGIETATPFLFIELARLYSKKSLAPLEKIHPVSTSPALPAKGKITSGLSVKTQSMIDAGILSFSCTSRLFPSIKLHFSIVKFAKHLRLEGPLTELSVIPFFNVISEGMNDILKSLEKQKAEKTPVPVCLFVPDMSSFAVEYLCSEWPASRRDCREMLSYLEEMLEFPLFKVKVK